MNEGSDKVTDKKPELSISHAHTHVLGISVSVSLYQYLCQGCANKITRYHYSHKKMAAVVSVFVFST